MLTFEGINENFKFLIAETRHQMKSTVAFLANPTPEDYESIVSRDDYIDNLKVLIENQCFKRIDTEDDLEEPQKDRIRAVHTIAVNLERIADIMKNIVRQVGHFKDRSFINQFDYLALFDKVSEGLDRVYPSMEKKDVGGALDICRRELEIDVLYKQNFDIIMDMLRKTHDIDDFITSLFIFRYIERIGDALLNIGEALLFGIIGQKIKIHQFKSLKQTLEEAGFETPIEEIDFQKILGTRSGCKISKLENPAPGVTDARKSIFKDGKIQKIQAEKENLVRWGELFPGLAPEVFSYIESDDTASLLEQFIEGTTFDELVLNSDVDELAEATASLAGTMENIWTETKTDKSVETDFVEQIRKRLGRIRSIHPDYYRLEKQFGDKKIASSEELLDDCASIEESLRAPFSMLIHGDFNSNNIIYNRENKSIHFIDVYRSREYDYVQDISVFMISNFRMPIYSQRERNRINGVITVFYKYFTDVAKKWEDQTFQARLALALARSFYTSTRFEFHPKFSKEMYLRAHYLLEKLTTYAAVNGDWKDFELPVAVLFF